MDSVIELQRQTHEEVERFERALYTMLSRPQPSHDARLRNEHNASQMLDRISSRANALNSSYQDEDSRKLELDALSAPSQANDLSEFYSRLVKIQEHHSKYPDSIPGGFDLELAALLEEPDPENADEEYEEEDRAYSSSSSSPPFSFYVSSYLFVVFWRRGVWEIS
jgi:splicing factor 3A subunit 3